MVSVPMSNPLGPALIAIFKMQNLPVTEEMERGLCQQPLPDEIVVTPEMVEAGEDILLCALGGAVSTHWWPDELAKQVYLAMAKRCPR
jgi:hypothetical protein